MIFSQIIKSSRLVVWIYEVLLASPFSLKMTIATDTYKQPVLDWSAHPPRGWRSSGLFY